MTRAYWPPERVCTDGQCSSVTPATDSFMFGTLMWQCVTLGKCNNVFRTVSLPFHQITGAQPHVNARSLVELCKRQMVSGDNTVSGLTLPPGEHINTLWYNIHMSTFSSHTNQSQARSHHRLSTHNRHRAPALHESGTDFDTDTSD